MNTRQPFLFLLLAFPSLIFAGSGGERTPIEKANYRQAARFSRAKIKKLVGSTAVDPHWLKHSDRFWYTYEGVEGKIYYLVDPDKKTKTVLFDNAHMAALITEITKDPYDARHLPIKKIMFIKDDRVIEFDVKSSQDEEKKKEGEDEGDKKDEDGDGGDKKDEDGDGGDKKENVDKKDEDGDNKKENVDKKDEDGDEKDGDKQDGDKKDDEVDKKDKKKKKKKKDKPKKKNFHFEYEITTGKLTLIKDYKVPEDKPKWASISPDEERVVFGRNFNLYWMDKANYEKCLKDEDDESVVEHQLTTDGEEFYSYAMRDRNEDNVKKEENKDKRKRVFLAWSRDSKKVALTREDSRKVKDLWVINSLSNPRPTLESYKYAMPGEEGFPQRELHVIDIESKEQVVVKTEMFKDQYIDIYRAPRLKKNRDDKNKPALWLSQTSDKLYFGRRSRDMHRAEICVADTGTGEVKVLVKEELNTYVETQTPYLINNGEMFIHWSERTGWAHYYLYDADGNLINPITEGPYHPSSIEGVDEKKQLIYFTANAREKNEDPYYDHLYRVKFDGSGMTLLNRGNYSHDANMNDSARFFVNTYSRVNTAPVSDLRDNTGVKILDLETADLSLLMDTGYKFPEPFKVKADDGVTDIYGVMFKPIDFDANKLYPVIEFVYPGPFWEAVSQTFRAGDEGYQLAQMGFIVVQIGNRGGHPGRSKWYHNYGYGNLRDYGLADKKAGLEQLADRHPYIDIEKVGIYGHSGGGFMSTAAMLVYPDFFKVAVSSAGNHDNSVYNAWWSEKHHGIKEVVDKEGKITFEYNIKKNVEIAGNLKGRLLLATGDIDNNVHPAGTLRVAEALIKANKRFDFMVLPGQRHGFGKMGEYFFWIRADYFAKHLIGDYRDSVDISVINRDKAKTR